VLKREPRTRVNGYIERRIPSSDVGRKGDEAGVVVVDCADGDVGAEVIVLGIGVEFAGLRRFAMIAVGVTGRGI